jgi:hypothetical protein
VDEKYVKLPRLSYIEGVDELIENARTVADPLRQEDELWEGYTDDECTNYEYC